MNNCGEKSIKVTKNDDFVTSSHLVTVFVTEYSIGIQQIMLECDEVTSFSVLSCPRARESTW